jgi:protein TonB
MKRGRWIVAAALAVLLVTAAVSLRSYSTPRATAPVRSALEYIQLGVERDGSSLRVRWDRNSPTVRDATRAVLHVQDGDIQVDRILTASDLSSGSAAYEPKNSDLAFRLDVYSANPHATGQLQVMNLASPPEIAQARPAEVRTQPEPRATSDARYPAFKPVVNVEPVGAQSIAKTDEVSDIPPPVVKPVDRPKPEAPEAAPRRFDKDQTKSPDAPDSPAPKVSDNSSPPRAAIATERAVAPSVPKPNIPIPDIPITSKGPTVSVLAEPVSSKLGHVVGKVPLLRRLNGHDNVAPAVPVYQAQPSLKLPNQQQVTEPVLVDVKVDVAESGKVKFAEITEYGDPPNFSLANAALAAARQWTFTPARAEDLPVSSQVVLHFRFNP